MPQTAAQHLFVVHLAKRRTAKIKPIHGQPRHRIFSARNRPVSDPAHAPASRGRRAPAWNWPARAPETPSHPGPATSHLAKLLKSISPDTLADGVAFLARSPQRRLNGERSEPQASCCHQCQTTGRVPTPRPHPRPHRHGLAGHSRGWFCRAARRAFPDLENECQRYGHRSLRS